MKSSLLITIMVLLMSGSVLAKDKEKKEKKNKATLSVEKAEKAEKVSEQANPSFDQLGESMRNSMVDMIRMMYKTVFTEYSKKENTDLIASYYKNLYDSLIEKGFTKEEAMKIILSAGIPSISGK